LKKQLSRLFKGIASLISFLTIVPTKIYEIELAAEFFYLVPVIGVFEGVIVGMVMSLNLPIVLRAGIATCLIFLITGFNHIDGFADFVDVLASRRRGKNALRIMKEVHRGSVAIASTILIILITFCSMICLGKYAFAHILITVVVSTEAMFILAVLSEEPDYPGLGKLFISKSKNTSGIILNAAVLATFFTLMYLVLSYSIVYMMLAIAVTMICCAYTFDKASNILGYVTGDVLGFCFELSRTSCLLVLAIASSLGI